jgi:hypothetical protein
VDVSSSSIVVVLASGSDVSLTEYEQPTKTGELQWLVSAGFSSDSGLGAVVGAQYEWSDANVGLGLGLGAEATAGVEVSSSLTWSFGSAGKSAADALIAEFASRDADDESGVMSLIDAALNSGSVPPQPIETAYHFGVEATASASGSVTIPVMDGIGVALGGNLDGQVSALAGVSVNRLLGQRTYDFVLQGSASGGASAGVEVGIGELGLEVGVGVQGNSNDEFTAGLTVNSKGTPVALSFGTDVVGGLNVGPVVGVSAGGDDEVGSGDQDEASLFDLGADVDPSLNVAGGEPRLALDEQFELSNKSMLAAGLAILEAAWPDFSLLTALQLPATSTMPTPSAVQTLLAELGSAKGQLGLQLYSETSQTDQESQFAIGVGVGFAVSGEETTSSSTLLSADFWADNALVPWAACPPQAAQPADQVFAAALTPMEDATGFHVVQTAPGFSETMDVEQHAVSAHLVITEQEPGTPEQKPATPEGTFDVVVINGKEYVRGADTASVGSLLVTLRRDPSDAATLVGTWLEVPLQVQGGDLEEFSPTGFGECMAQHGTLETIGVREYPPPDGSAAVPVVAVPVLEIDDKGDPAGTVQQRIYIDLDITAYGSIIEDDQLAASVAGSTPVDCGSDNLWLHTVFSAYGDDVAITAPADPVVLGG